MATKKVKVNDITTAVEEVINICYRTNISELKSHNGFMIGETSKPYKHKLFFKMDAPLFEKIKEDSRLETSGSLVSVSEINDARLTEIIESVSNEFVTLTITDDMIAGKPWVIDGINNVAFDITKEFLHFRFKKSEWVNISYRFTKEARLFIQKEYKYNDGTKFSIYRTFKTIIA